MPGEGGEKEMANKKKFFEVGLNIRIGSNGAF